MNIKNAFMATINNFTLILKELLYSLVVILLVVFSLYGVLKPVFSLLAENGWFDSVADLIECVYTKPVSFASQFKAVAGQLFELITTNARTLWGSFVFSIAIVVIVPVFALNLANYTIGEVLHEKLTSWADYGFMQKFVSTLGRGVLYALIQTAISLPFTALCIGACILYGSHASNWLLATVLLPVLELILLTILSFQKTVTIWLMPTLVSEEVSVSKGFGLAISRQQGNFGKLWFQCFVLYIVEVLVCVITAVFTLCAGLVLVLPTIVVTNTAFSLISYYNNQKLRYYTKENTIVKPL